MKTINKWKIMIPTWFIGIWYFFGAFGWTLAIAITLTIFQAVQKKRILSKMNDEESYYDDLKKVIAKYNKDDGESMGNAEELEKTIFKRNDELERLNEEILNSKKEKEIFENKIKKLNELLQFKEQKLNNIEKNISEIIEEAEKEIYDKKIEADKRLSSIQSEIEKVQSGLEDAKKLSLEKYNLEKELDDIQKEIDSIEEELKILNDEAVEKYYIFGKYDKISREDCMNRLSILKEREKTLRKNEEDIYFIYDFQDKRTKPRVTRQILRNFNADCESIMSNINMSNIDATRNRIRKSYETINNLYSDYYASITEEMLSLKLEQATLLYTAELKKHQERETQKAIRERMMEEAREQKELEERKKKIEKDLQQHIGEVNRMMKYMRKTQVDSEKQFYIDKIKELEDKIKTLEFDKETVLEREANAKAGFVYIISNIGSFGEGIYKIGMTRRLEPMDRIKELSSASVPFEFDVHAMIFSSDAPELETMLHKHFANNAVNKVNPRKEFYNVDIDEIEKVVKENYNDTVQFTKIPIAAEYRQSLNLAEKE